MRKKTIVFLRRITASLPQRVYFVHFLIFLFWALFIFLSASSIIIYLELKEAREVRKETLSNFTYWTKVSDKHPNSPDAFFEAGYYALKLGNIEEAKKYLEKALKLDPSFEKAEKLLLQLTN